MDDHIPPPYQSSVDMLLNDEWRQARLQPYLAKAQIESLGKTKEEKTAIWIAARQAADVEISPILRKAATSILSSPDDIARSGRSKEQVRELLVRAAEVDFTRFADLAGDPNTNSTGLDEYIEKSLGGISFSTPEAKRQEVVETGYAMQRAAVQAMVQYSPDALLANIARFEKAVANGAEPDSDDKEKAVISYFRDYHQLDRIQAETLALGAMQATKGSDFAQTFDAYLKKEINAGRLSAPDRLEPELRREMVERKTKEVFLHRIHGHKDADWRTFGENVRMAAMAVHHHPEEGMSKKVADQFVKHWHDVTPYFHGQPTILMPLAVAAATSSPDITLQKIETIQRHSPAYAKAMVTPALERANYTNVIEHSDKWPAVLNDAAKARTFIANKTPNSWERQITRHATKWFTVYNDDGHRQEGMDLLKTAIEQHAVKAKGAQNIRVSIPPLGVNKEFKSFDPTVEDWLPLFKDNPHDLANFIDGLLLANPRHKEDVRAYIEQQIENRPKFYEKLQKQFPPAIREKQKPYKFVFEQVPDITPGTYPGQLPQKQGPLSGKSTV